MKKIFYFLFSILLTSHSIYSQSPQYYNYNTTGNGNSYPLNQANGKCIQVAYPPNAFNLPSPAPAGNITKLYLRMAATSSLGPVTYTNFKIIFAQATLDSLPAWYTGSNMDTVYQRANVTMSAGAGSWLDITLDHSFNYNPAIGLIIQIEQCGATGNYTGYSLAHSIVTTKRRAVSVGGCPYAWSAMSVGIPNVGIDMQVVSINSDPGKLSNFKLEQNYPNPFNPETNINFSIPESGNIRLVIYDIIGNEIMQLYDGYKNAGDYSVSFNAENLPSGMYIYKLFTDKYTDSRKMVLIK